MIWWSLDNPQTEQYSKYSKYFKYSSYDQVTNGGKFYLLILIIQM